jgi:hypothetical protein
VRAQGAVAIDTITSAATVAHMTPAIVTAIR